MGPHIEKARCRCSAGSGSSINSGLSASMSPKAAAILSGEKKRCSILLNWFRYSRAKTLAGIEQRSRSISSGVRRVVVVNT